MSFVAVTERTPRRGDRVFGYDDNDQPKHSKWLDEDWRKVRIAVVANNEVTIATPVPSVAVRYEGENRDSLSPMTHWQPVPEPEPVKE